MKKKISLLIITILLLVPIKVFAISGNVYCSPGNKTVTVGETFTVTISGSADGVTDWAAADVVNVTGVLSLVGDGGRSFFQQDSNSFSKSYTIKANSVGTGSINQLISYTTNPEEGKDTSVWSSKCNITVVAATSSNTNNNKPSNNTNNTRKPDPNKSSNNNLKSLSIENVELTPEFNKDTLEYSAIVEGTIEKITINAEAEDGKSNIDGLGEKELQEGLNEITLYVNAENGDVKEYKINITRKEKNPIEVTIDGKKYTVIKKEVDMELPEGYSKETIMINEEEVTAYTNEKVGRTLVVLVDEEGNKGFFIYDNKKDTYTEFKEFKSKEIKILITSNPGKEIPFGYKKITFSINGQKVNGYYYKTKDKFRLVYGVNLDTGDEGFYQYDMNQKTFQRYYGNQLKDYYKYAKYAVIVVGAIVLLFIIFFISTISLLVKNRKLKKNGVIQKKEVKKEEPKVLTRAERLRLKEETAKELTKKEEIKEEKKDTKPVKFEETKTEVLDKRELKRIQKEKERKLKEEADNFLK